MRIAFLTHEPFHPPSGGGSAAAVYLVRELVRRGHAVEVFAPQPGDAGEVARNFGIQLHPFTRWRMGRTASLRTPKYLAYPGALASEVAKAAAAGRTWDVLLAQHSISAVAAGRLRRRLRIPAVFNLLDCLTGFMETWPPWKMPRRIASALVRYELSLPRRFEADGVLTVSDGLRERILATGYAADRTRSIYYGYDASSFRPGAELPPPSRTPMVVMHGSFDHHHLGAIAVDAITAVARTRPDVLFRFIGPRTPALKRSLARVRAGAPQIRIEETGFIPYEEVPRQLAEGWVGITPYQPSTGTHCAFVAKTVEYLALGLPVVSTPLDSAVRYFGGMNGIRFSAADGTGFATAVLDWLQQPREERARSTQEAQHKVAAELDWPAVCSRAAEFVEATVERSRAQS